MNWQQSKEMQSKSYKCGYCGEPLASNRGFESAHGNIYICHFCNKPTFFDDRNRQYPGALIGNTVKHIPRKEVEDLFMEARRCYAVSSYTAAVMCCRKLLMNIAVAEGAKERDSFVEYVNYLESNNYIPPKGKDWVEQIRKLGNEANHKIIMKTKPEAEKILIFTEMLLRFIYELPGIMNGGSETATEKV